MVGDGCEYNFLFEKPLENRTLPPRFKKKYKKLHFLLGHTNINGVFFLRMGILMGIPNDLVFLCKLKLQFNLFLYFKNYVAIT